MIFVCARARTMRPPHLILERSLFPRSILNFSWLTTKTVLKTENNAFLWSSDFNFYVTSFVAFHLLRFRSDTLFLRL